MPDKARTRFLPSTERDPNHSSRINSKRKSYRSSSRKRRKEGQELNGLINGLEISSDEEEESLERKLARLRREVAEVKESVQNRDSESGKVPGFAKESESLDALSQVLDSISPSPAAEESSAASRLAKRLGSTATTKETPAAAIEAEDSHQNGNSSRDTGSYPPRSQEDYTLSKISDFDSRLAQLETALGIDAIPLPTQERTAAKAVLPSLDTLDKQLNAISTSSDLFLDKASQKVRQLTQDAENLEHARKAAKAAQEALRQEALSPSSNSSRPVVASEVSQLPEIEDPEQVSKINALYGTLSTIESLATMLPSVLDRLRSLRSLHADAATASQTLTKVESRQEEMKEEIQGWREGLEKVEKAMERGESTMKVNTEMVDGWVKDLEDRMRKLGQ